MAHIDVLKTYRITLTPDEYRILGQALVTLGTADALALNRQITASAHSQQALAAEASQHAATSAAGLAEKVLESMRDARIR